MDKTGVDQVIGITKQRNQRELLLYHILIIVYKQENKIM
jgi:hypothetical protein